MRCLRFAPLIGLSELLKLRTSCVAFETVGNVHCGRARIPQQSILIMAVSRESMNDPLQRGRHGSKIEPWCDSDCIRFRELAHDPLAPARLMNQQLTGN